MGFVWFGDSIIPDLVAWVPGLSSGNGMGIYHQGMLVSLGYNAVVCNGVISKKAGICGSGLGTISVASARLS